MIVSTQKIYIVLILLCSVEMRAQDPHRVPDSQITAENFYNAVSNLNERAMRAEIHPETNWEMPPKKMIEYLFAANSDGTIQFLDMEYEPLDNNRIRVTGFYSFGGDKIPFVHLWQLKERRLTDFCRIEPSSAP